MYTRIVTLVRHVEEHSTNRHGVQITVRIPVTKYVILDKNYREVESEHATFELAKQQLDAEMALERQCATCED